MAAGGLMALDVAETQILINFDDDPNFRWHQRILIQRLGDNRYSGFTPDLDAEVIDLREHFVIPLVRAARYPQRVLGNAYALANLSEDDLLRARQECLALAAIVGPATLPGAGAAAASDWRFGDTSFARFGEVVEPDIARNPQKIVTREASALVRVEHEGDEFWTYSERVTGADLDEWTEEKRSGPGRDKRILPVKRDLMKHRYRSLRDCLAETSFPDPKARGSDWPFPGPSALKELLTAMRASGEEIIGFNDYYCRASGLSPDHPVAIKHRDFLAILFHLLSFDQVNSGELAGAECVARYVLQIHQAVKRNPKAPDFKGTAIMVQSELDSSGGVLTGDFGRYIADEQKTLAFALKQQRLYSEEEEKRKSHKTDGKK